MVDSVQWFVGKLDCQAVVVILLHRILETTQVQTMTWQTRRDTKLCRNIFSIDVAGKQEMAIHINQGLAFCHLNKDKDKGDGEFYGPTITLEAAYCGILYRIRNHSKHFPTSW